MVEAGCCHHLCKDTNAELNALLADVVQGSTT
jgi:hypothetical protein